MKEPNVIANWLDSPVAHILTASFISAGMIAAMMVKLLLHDPHVLNIVLLVAISGASVPLLLSLVQQVFRGNFSVDILALLSIVTSLVLGQYWVAAIVVLMLSGGQALEGFATRRASSVLNALAKRIPQTAHRTGAAVEDVSIDAIVVGDELIIYPHEICPVDGLVVSGQGSMDESYLTGEPFLIEKAPGTNVLSGSINGNVALTIRATKIASDSRFAKIVEVLHASEENRPQIQRLGDRLGAWYTPMAITIALASWYLQRPVGTVPRCTGHRYAMPAADFNPGSDHRCYFCGRQAGHHHQGPVHPRKDRHLPHSDRRQDWHANLRQAGCHIH